VLLSAVTPAALAGRYRDVPPGPVLDLGAQARSGCFRAPGPRLNVMGVRFVGLWRVTAAK
jgi:hypothetical protein